MVVLISMAVVVAARPQVRGTWPSREPLRRPSRGSRRGRQGHGCRSEGRIVDRGVERRLGVAPVRVTGGRGPQVRAGCRARDLPAGPGLDPMVIVAAGAEVAVG